ncbi:ROK family transcriptional regulator [Phytoactinopolyspora alkaliphila]|uniref:ROK family transcriptional regulator n=1 Tax=Phytoactinopolyspora alkaliphila TaxID=1783498 RepID=A0A6N9YIJ0_9ACTN|nr:ROK family transcriptional regulator [Phytoactinopolyspora alkaliphila]NED94679.1 ROK family transcriptional regulator [Phytoactinopolyspora alkaliphila]
MASGPGDVLALIRTGTARTRGEIMDATGLSRMTVAQRVDALLADGLIRHAGTASASRGRRATHLEFNAAHSVVVVAAVETTHARVAVTDLVGRVLVEHDIEVAVADGPESALHAVSQAIDQSLEHTGVTRSQVSGVGVSIPGPVDPDTARPSQPPIMPGWDAYPVADHLEDALGTGPVLVENDANVMALGEQSTNYPSCDTLCFVKVSTGIGTGIVLNGRIYHGVDGGAGDIGHVRLSDYPDAVCQCGSRGCLAAVASGRAVASALSGTGIEAHSGRDVSRLLAQGDTTAMGLTQDAGRRIGEVMATVVCLLNPEILVIGGALASAPLISGVRESLYPLSLPRATRHLDVRLSTFGENAAVVGMTRMVVDHVFAPAAVDARLAAR